MLTPSEKGPLSSLTIVSAAASGLISLANAAGLSIPVEAGPALSQIAAGLLAGVAIYGRWRATKIIK